MSTPITLKTFGEMADALSNYPRDTPLQFDFGDGHGSHVAHLTHYRGALVIVCDEPNQFTESVD